MSRRVSPLAGFQVIIIGRFWVITEVGFLFLALVLFGWLVTSTCGHRKFYWSAIAILCLLGVVGLDVWAPKPRPQGLAKGSIPQGQRSLTERDIEEIREAMKKAMTENPSTPAPKAEAKPEHGKAPEPFSFSVGGAFIAPSRERTDLMWIGYNSTHGNTLSPSNAAFYARLQNLQKTSTRLSGYEIETETNSKGQWVGVVKLDSRFGQFYAIANNDFKRATKVDSKCAFDAELAAKSYVLNSGETIEGWIWIEYPAEFPSFAGNYRFSVADINGHQWSRIVGVGNRKNRKNTNFLGGDLVFSGVEDVSTFYRKYYDAP
jgi:hypothetical protein